jgi:pimeloyl-ACP methyl ester carboxylesterase
MRRGIAGRSVAAMTISEPQQTRDGAYVDAGGVHTYYEVTGSGDPLVMLHGGMCTAETCDAQVAALAEHYRVFVPERRGHGRTPDVEGPITYSIMADDTICFIEALGIEPAHVIGFSDGGAVALLLALRRPDLARKLVLIGQWANSDGAAPETRAMMESLSADVLPPMLKALYAAVSPDGPDHFEAVFEKLKPSWLGADDVELPELAKIPAPTLVLLGDRDMLTVEHAAAMQRALPDGQLAVVPGARHSLPWDRPELVNRLLLDFLTADA